MGKARREHGRKPNRLNGNLEGSLIARIKKEDTDFSSDIQKLIKCARKAQDSFEYDLALQFYEKALAQTPDDTNLLDETADLLLEVNRIEDAKKMLQKSADLKPEDGFSKWLYLAQLSEGEESLKLYMKGLEVITKLLEKERNREKCAELKSQYCACCCAVAELYMTDLCFDTNADRNCKEVLEKALKYDDGSHEVYQLLASYNLSIENNLEAVRYAKEASTRLKSLIDKTSSGDVEYDATFSSKLSAAKVLTECGEFDPSCYEDAAIILSELEAENDEDIDVLTLFGVVLQRLENPDIDGARHTFENALNLLKKQREEILKVSLDPISVEDIDAHILMIREQLDMLAKKSDSNIVGESGSEELNHEDDNSMDTN